MSDEPIEGWARRRVGWLRIAEREEPTGYPPSGVERRSVERFVSLRGARVLEIGCGNGRLTFEYAARAERVEAFDPNPLEIGRARRGARVRRTGNVRFHVRAVQDWTPTRARFDVALFTWSL